MNYIKLRTLKVEDLREENPGLISEFKKLER